MRILIAEDEMMSRKMLQKTLERAGYEVTVVENGGRWTSCARQTDQGLLCWTGLCPSWMAPVFAAKCGKGMRNRTSTWCCLLPKNRRRRRRRTRIWGR